MTDLRYLSTREATEEEWAALASRIKSPAVRAMHDAMQATVVVDGVRLIPPGGLRSPSVMLRSAPGSLTHEPLSEAHRAELARGAS